MAVSFAAGYTWSDFCLCLLPQVTCGLTFAPKSPADLQFIEAIATQIAS